jgi:hypothetical protein
MGMMVISIHEIAMIYKSQTENENNIMAIPFGL